MKHLAETAASWWITWVLFGLTAWCGAALLLAWVIHRCRRYLAGRPVPYWPADPLDAAIEAVTCRWCAAKPTGRCTCGIACGHRQCPRLSLADLEYLDHGTEMPR